MKTIALFPILVFLICGCATVTPTDTPRTPDNAPSFVNQEKSKVVLLILENQKGEREGILKLPFISYVKEHGAYFSNYYAVAHPSQPNYVAMISGSYSGVRGDEPSVIDRPHIGTSANSWAVYAEGYPRGVCISDAFYGGNARKHIPFLSFKDVIQGQNCRTNIRPFDDFAVDLHADRLPSLSLLIPNLAHDGHDRPLEEGAAWLDRVLSPIIQVPAFKEKVIFIVTFDEADWVGGDKSRGNSVVTLIFGRSVAPNCVVHYVYNHFDLARTISALIGEPAIAGDDLNARIITGMWGTCSN